MFKLLQVTVLNSMLDIILIDKVLLFLNGGKPEDSDKPVCETLRDLNGQLNNSVVVFTFFLSTGWYCFLIHIKCP